MKKTLRNLKRFRDAARSYATAHKAISVIVVIAILGASYWSFKTLGSKSGETRYVTAPVEKGTLITSITGSGQVSASNQVDLKPKVAGDIIYIGVQNGQWVGAGTLIVQLDAQDAQKTVRDAEANLESAQLSLEKLKQSSADIAKIVEDSFNSVSNAFLDFPGVINDAKEIIADSTINTGQSNDSYYLDFVSATDTTNRNKAEVFISIAKSDYANARAKYDEVFLLYKNTSRYADAATVTTLLAKTVELAKSLSQALKSEQNVLSFIDDYASDNSRHLPSLITTYQDTLGTDIGQTNSHLSDLIGIQNNLKNVPLDIASQELNIKQKENALLDAKEKLADYFVRAPFDGTIAKLDAKKADSVTASTIVATLITTQKIAEVSLNEVDVAKIKIGQKATLTFDAVEGLSIAGKVAEVDTVGTVSQGVVTYNVKIGFDTQDDRVKPGMSVDASIITDVKQDVLVVPNSAVKLRGDTYYVEIPDTPLPRQQQVEIGLSNDTDTEIVSGLKEGDEIIIRTITPAANQPSQQQAPSLFGTPRGTTGGTRVPAR